MPRKNPEIASGGPGNSMKIPPRNHMQFSSSGKPEFQDFAVFGESSRTISFCSSDREKGARAKRDRNIAARHYFSHLGRPEVPSRIFKKSIADGRENSGFFQNTSNLQRFMCVLGMGRIPAGELAARKLAGGNPAHAQNTHKSLRI